MSRVTEEQRVARIKRLVSASRCLVTGQQGITVAVNHILGCLYELGDDWVERYPEFSAYRGELPLEVPIGTERLLWSFDKLLELDPALAELELKHRPHLMKRCCEIIREFS